MEGRRVVERLGEASEGEVVARHGHVVNNNVEHEVHPAFVQIVAELLQVIGGVKMGI